MLDPDPELRVTFTLQGTLSDRQALVALIGNYAASQQVRLTTIKIEDVTPDDTPLSKAEKASLLEDYKEWSGGFSPQEMDDYSHTVYIDYSLPDEFERRAHLVREFFKTKTFLEEEDETTD